MTEAIKPNEAAKTQSDLSILGTPDLWLAVDLINGDGVETINDEPLIQMCGNCGHKLVAFHNSYSGNSETFREVMCPECEAALFRYSSVVASKGAARQLDPNTIQSYIHARADMKFWHGGMTIGANVDNEMALVKSEGKMAAKDYKIHLEGAIDWKPHCPSCGKHLEAGKFDFHHWDYENDTGVVLCRECHDYIHKNSPTESKLKYTDGEWKKDAIKRLVGRARENGQLMGYSITQRFNIPVNDAPYIKEATQ